MTTPTNDRQTSERERLAEWLESAGKGILTSEIARQLRAAEAEIAALRIANESAEDDVRTLAGQVRALRAENEALRTATDEDVISACRVYAKDFGNGWQMPCNQMRDAIQSFIRSKESRRG